MASMQEKKLTDVIKNQTIVCPQLDSVTQNAFMKILPLGSAFLEGFHFEAGFFPSVPPTASGLYPTD